MGHLYSYGMLLTFLLGSLSAAFFSFLNPILRLTSFTSCPQQDWEKEVVARDLNGVTAWVTFLSPDPIRT